jgi:hypothetical protein
VNEVSVQEQLAESRVVRTQGNGPGIRRGDDERWTSALAACHGGFDHNRADKARSTTAIGNAPTTSVRAEARASGQAWGNRLENRERRVAETSGVFQSKVPWQSVRSMTHAVELC